METLKFENVLSNEEMDERIKKLASKNWKVQKLLETLNVTENIMQAWNLPTREPLLKLINVTEPSPGIFVDKKQP